MLAVFKNKIVCILDMIINQAVFKTKLLPTLSNWTFLDHPCQLTLCGCILAISRAMCGVLKWEPLSMMTSVHSLLRSRALTRDWRAGGGKLSLCVFWRAGFSHQPFSPAVTGGPLRPWSVTISLGSASILACSSWFAEMVTCFTG